MASLLPVALGSAALAGLGKGAYNYFYPTPISYKQRQRVWNYQGHKRADFPKTYWRSSARTPAKSLSRPEAAFVVANTNPFGEDNMTEMLQEARIPDATGTNTTSFCLYASADIPCTGTHCPNGYIKMLSPMWWDDTGKHYVAAVYCTMDADLGNPVWHLVYWNNDTNISDLGKSWRIVGAGARAFAESGPDSTSGMFRCGQVSCPIGVSGSKVEGQLVDPEPKLADSSTPQPLAVIEKEYEHTEYPVTTGISIRRRFQSASDLSFKNFSQYETATNDNCAQEIISAIPTVGDHPFITWAGASGSTVLHVEFRMILECEVLPGISGICQTISPYSEHFTKLLWEVSNTAMFPAVVTGHSFKNKVKKGAGGKFKLAVSPSAPYKQQGMGGMRRGHKSYNTRSRGSRSRRYTPGRRYTKRAAY
jgi:hypothetical protein